MNKNMSRTHLNHYLSIVCGHARHSLKCFGSFLIPCHLHLHCVFATHHCQEYISILSKYMYITNIGDMQRNKYRVRYIYIVYTSL